MTPAATPTTTLAATMTHDTATARRRAVRSGCCRMSVMASYAAYGTRPGSPGAAGRCHNPYSYPLGVRCANFRERAGCGLVLLWYPRDATELNFPPALDER